MIVEFYAANENEAKKVLTLQVRDGRAVGTFGDKSLADYVLRGKYGENPGQTVGYTAEDGEAFLRVLPRNFSGHRFFARIVESEEANVYHHQQAAESIAKPVQKPTNVYRYRSVSEEEKPTWSAYNGPRGGTGWVNSSGDVAYQEEMPGDDWQKPEVDKAPVKPEVASAVADKEATASGAASEKVKSWATKKFSNPEHAKAFTNWFGDSNVVNEDGEPQETHNIPSTGSIVKGKDGTPTVVYHGTSRGGFSTFDKSKADKDALYGAGFYFTESDEIASSYTSKGDAEISQVQIHQAQMIEARLEATLPDNWKLRTRTVNATDEHGGQTRLVDPQGKEHPLFVRDGKTASIRGDDAYDALPSVFGWDSQTTSSWRDMLKNNGVEWQQPEVKAVYLNIRKPFHADSGTVTPRQLGMSPNKENRAANKYPYPDDLTEKRNAAWKQVREGVIPRERFDELDRSWDQEALDRHLTFDQLREYGRETGNLGTLEERQTMRGEDIAVGVATHINSLLQKSGYDGITHIGGDRMGGGHKHRVWIAFEPTQIKSVGNRGTFNRKSANINERFVYRYRPLSEAEKASWTAYTGPRGGDGWVNSATGKVEYVEEMPGGDRDDEPTVSNIDSVPAASDSGLATNNPIGDVVVLSEVDSKKISNHIRGTQSLSNDDALHLMKKYDASYSGVVFKYRFEGESDALNEMTSWSKTKKGADNFRRAIGQINGPEFVEGGSFAKARVSGVLDVEKLKQNIPKSLVDKYTEIRSAVTSPDVEEVFVFDFDQFVLNNDRKSRKNTESMVQVYKYRSIVEKDSADSWSPYRGQYGGTGWVNATGDVRYQTKKPGDDKTDARDAPASQAAATSVASPTATTPTTKPPATRLRKDMPQIAGVDKPDFFAVLRHEGHTVTDREVPVSQVKMMQSDHNPDKVAAMVAKLKDGKPIGTSRSIISSDGYVMDGNHRVLAQLAVDKNSMLPVSHIDMTADELIDRMGSYGRSFKVDSKEGIGERRAGGVANAIDVPDVSGRVTAADIEAANSIPPPTSQAGIDKYLADVGNTEVYKEVNELLGEIKDKTISGDVRYASIEMNVKCCPSGEDILNGRVEYTPQRKALHKKIADEMLPEDTKAAPGKRPTAVLLIGPPGAGKSSAGNPLIQELGVKFATINNDDVKAALPEHDGWNAAMVHEESSEIVENQVMPRAIDDKHNILFDGVGNNSKKMLEIANDLVSGGFDVHLVHVTIPTEKTVVRAWGRFAKSAFQQGKDGPGRYVPVEYIAKSVDQGPTKTYQELRDSGLVDSWSSYSNDVPKGTKPLVIDKGKKVKKHAKR